MHHLQHTTQSRSARARKGPMERTLGLWWLEHACQLATSSAVLPGISNFSRLLSDFLLEHYI